MGGQILSIVNPNNQKEMSDPVNHPKHYTEHPSGVECIQITEHMNFCLGNAMKYIWRADLKNDAVEDLKKARWYLDREIQRREAYSNRVGVAVRMVLADRGFRKAPDGYQPEPDIHDIEMVGSELWIKDKE